MLLQITHKHAANASRGARAAKFAHVTARTQVGREITPSELRVLLREVATVLRVALMPHGVTVNCAEHANSKPDYIVQIDLTIGPCEHDSALKISCL
ncbi:MAG: hypothetical protein EAZ30_09640 [Betaproteobacteria bacterium]|nr:MAG: hypothetical protein EAZ43_06945 [Betaproteobacteria bacterium]TAG47446.1 MAG: hypothetical protein EAZ30_09640 [Betaproteobacteria bacterium]